MSRQPVRRIQAVAVEVLLGLIAVIYGIHGLLPNKSLLYRLLQESGAAQVWALWMVGAGSMLLLACSAHRYRWRRAAAIALNVGWCTTGYLFVRAGEYGPPVFTSVVFFTFLCLISLDGWE